MANGPQLRRRLFAEGAAALARGRPDILEAEPQLRGHYACPLCLRMWPIEALTSEPRALTLDEAPPKASARAPMARVLVCKDCNNRAGYTLEHELKKRRDVEDFANERLVDPIKVAFEAGGVRVPAQIRHEDNRLVVLGVPPATSPEDLAAHQAWFDDQVALGSSAGGSFSIHLSAWDQRLSQVALLKAAYLAAFATFGYTYILRTDFNPVRGEIAEPGHGGLVRLPILTDVSQDETTHRIIQVVEPIRALACQIGHELVLLPHVEPNPRFWDEMSAIVGAGNGQLSCDGVGEWPRYPQYLLDT